MVDRGGETTFAEIYTFLFEQSVSNGANRANKLRQMIRVSCSRNTNALRMEIMEKWYVHRIAHANWIQWI